jgi:hypothetical protein
MLQLVSFRLETQTETAEIPPAMLVAVIANIQRLVGMRLQAQEY